MLCGAFASSVASSLPADELFFGLQSVELPLPDAVPNPSAFSARELEEQRVLLEDRMRRTLKDHDEQVKEARGRMQARLAKLEQDKKRAIAMADNKQGAASAKKEAIAAVTSARAEMIAAISRLKREMEDRARQSQEEHAALLSKQREARIAREEKEKARILAIQSAIQYRQ